MADDRKSHPNPHQACINQIRRNQADDVKRTLLVGFDKTGTHRMWGVDIDYTQCIRDAAQRVITAEFEGLFRKCTRLDRRLMGKEFAELESTVDNKTDSMNVKRWLVTINFPLADGNPLWAPPTLPKRPKKASIVDKLWEFTQSTRMAGVKYCFEWSKKHNILHVHIRLVWTGTGGHAEILRSAQKAFKGYVLSGNDVDVKAFKSDPTPYLTKDPELYAEKALRTPYY